MPMGIAPGERRPALVFFHGGSQWQMLLGHYMEYYSNAYAMNQYLAFLGYINKTPVPCDNKTWYCLTTKPDNKTPLCLRSARIFSCVRRFCIPVPLFPQSGTSSGGPRPLMMSTVSRV
jgi:hypothetical protein